MHSCCPCQALTITPSPLTAMHLIVDVFLGGTISGIPAAVVIVLVLLKISKGGGKNSKIPAWFAVRQAEAQRREQCELSRIVCSLKGGSRLSCTVHCTTWSEVTLVMKHLNTYQGVRFVG